MLPTIESICCTAKTYLVILVVVLVAVNTPISVAQGDPIVLNKPPNNNHTKSYEEFYIEHTIAKKDAKQSFHDNYKTLMHGKRPSWCVACTPEIEHYCRTDMLKDHCCCDARHGKDPISWIPHECYIGKECKPRIGSCIKYTEYRECCCDRILAEEWSEVFSSGRTSTANKMSVFGLCAILVFGSRMPVCRII